MSFVHLVPDHHGDGLLGTMLLDYKSVKLYRKILLTTESIFEQILDWGLNSGRMWNIFDKKCQKLFFGLIGSVETRKHILACMWFAAPSLTLGMLWAPCCWTTSLLSSAGCLGYMDF